MASNDETAGITPKKSKSKNQVKATKGANYSEIGASGLKQAGGYIYEEFLDELKGQRGAKFYREMSENSPIVGALLLGYRQVAAHLPWEIQEPEEATSKDTAATEFIKDAFKNMDQSWESILHQALSELTFGWALHEVVYKKRDDGKIGWDRFPIRSQETLMNWVIGDHGSIDAMVQLDPVTGQRFEIPLTKALLFRTTDMKNNPEGQSMLRPAVIPYQYVRRIQEYEAIGIERDLAGLPVAWVPNEWLTSDDPQTKSALNQMIQMVKDVRRNEREGLVLPMVYEPELTGAISRNKALDFQLLASSGGRQFDTDKIITRYNQQIAMSLLGDFVTLGHDGMGSYALGATKMDLWVMVVDSICKGIAEVFNKGAIKKLLDLNGIEYDNPPELTYGQVENIDLAALGSFIQMVSSAGMITPDEGTEAWLREQAGMPPLDPGTVGVYDQPPMNPMTGLPLTDSPLHDPNDPKNKLPQTPDGKPVLPGAAAKPSAAKPGQRAKAPAKPGTKETKTTKPTNTTRQTKQTKQTRSTMTTKALEVMEKHNDHHDPHSGEFSTGFVTLTDHGADGTPKKSKKGKKRGKHEHGLHTWTSTEGMMTKAEDAEGQ